MQRAAQVKKRVSARLEYPYAEPPLPAELREVASGVYWLRMPLPFALEHINWWLLADGDGWTMVDCGFGTAVRTQPMVADSIVWAKLAALSEGAAIASRTLWGSKAA